MKIDLDQIRELLTVVSSTDVTELTIEFGDQRITVKKAPAFVTPTSDSSPKPIMVKTEMSSSTPVPVYVPSPPKPVAPSEPLRAVEPITDQRLDEKNGSVEITSPMVGTFYRSPSPESPPFVQVGDRVSIGQTVCIIEAMKLMNDMPSEVSGKILKVLVDNGTTVEYGQPLFLVDPKG